MNGNRALVMLSTGLLLVLGLVPLVYTVSPPDYSNAKQPVILFNVNHLEAARPPLTYGTSAVPATNGLVELQCELILETVRFVGGNVTLKWVLPNPTMYKEGRGYAKRENTWKSSVVTLAITQFKAEDAGDYSCQLFIDDKATHYKQTINIPALDGSPLLNCELRCERNQNEDCQVMEYAHVPCTAYGFPQPSVRCSSNECEEEDSCPPPIAFPLNPFLGSFGTSSSLYAIKREKVFDELALRSTRLYCEAVNGKETASTTVFVPVSVGRKKTQGPPPPPLPPQNAESSGVDGSTTLFLGRKTPEYYRLGERVQLLCWTNEDVGPIEWAFYNASTPNMKEPIANGTHPEFHYTYEEASGGYASEIVINAAKLKHGGIYECSATNQQDGSNRAVQLVMETYHWAEDADMNQDRQLRTGTGSTVTMKCTVVTTRSDPRVEWYKDGLYLETNERLQKSANQQILTITSATPEDNGVYTCTSRGRFSLVLDDLEGKTTLVVTDTGLHSEQITSIGNAIASLSTVQETLMSLSEALSKP